MLIEREPVPARGGAAAPVLDLHLRRLETLAEYRQCERLQARIWGPDDVGCVSALVMMTAQENGGMAIGAFVAERLVGFVCSFPGLTEGGALKQCSVLMAVEPEVRNGSVGFQLKRKQREVALAQGVELITWTFDPLASANANLNIRKLGCVVGHYFPNFYGTFTGGLNAGVETDRFLAEWWLREPRVEESLNGVPPALPATADRTPVNEVVLHPASGLPSVRDVDLGRSDPVLLVEAPPDIQAIKQADLGLARDWVGRFREIFPHYFACGYRVTGFVPLDGAGALRRAYVLSCQGHVARGPI